MDKSKASEIAANIVRDWYSDRGYLSDEIANVLFETHANALEEAAAYVEAFAHDALFTGCNPDNVPTYLAKAIRIQAIRHHEVPNE